MSADHRYDELFNRCARFRTGSISAEMFLAAESDSPSSGRSAPRRGKLIVASEKRSSEFVVPTRRIGNRWKPGRGRWRLARFERTTLTRIHSEASM